MLLTFVIAAELVASLAALAVLGAEPADRKQMLRRAAPATEPATAPIAAAPIAAAPIWLPHRSAVRAPTALNRSPLRLIRPPAPATRPAPAPAVRAAAHSGARVFYLPRTSRAGRASDRPPFDPAA